MCLQLWDAVVRQHGGRPAGDVLSLWLWWRLSGNRADGQRHVGQVVIKTFSLRDGSSLPQIVRESRSLDAAKRLEAEGIVDRRSFAESPPRVEYELTEKGVALLPLIAEMRRFGHEWLGCGVHGT